MPSEITYKDILLYKTESCRNWDERGFCRYGKRCRYAHGAEELRPISRSNQYKTKTCKAYHEGGSCPYGIRCTFIHHTNDKPAAPLNPKGPATSRILPIATASAPEFSTNATASASPANINIWDSMLGLSTYYNPLHYQQAAPAVNGSFYKPSYNGPYYYNPSISSLYSATLDIYDMYTTQ